MSFLDDAAQQARQQQMAVAILNVELRDRLAMVVLRDGLLYETPEIVEDILRRAYRVADVALRVRMEPPSAS